MNKPKPCPHCGEVSKVRKDGSAYFVRCDGCGASTKEVYRNSGVSAAAVQNFVIGLWNKR